MGREENDKPHSQSIDKRQDSHGDSGLPDAVRTPGTVIIADNRGRTLGHGVNRRLYHLADAGNDSHNRDVDISACDREHTVAADADQAVGKLHDKTGGSQADNVGSAGAAGADFRKRIEGKVPRR